MTEKISREEEKKKIREYILKYNNDLTEEEIEEAVNNLSLSTIEAFEQGLEKAKQEHSREKSPDELLLKYINEINNKEELVSRDSLIKNPPTNLTKDDIISMLDSIKEYPLLHSIRWIDRKKDTYYFNSAIMTDNFASTAVLLKEGSIQDIIAERTRRDCKIYPRPVQLKVLHNHPYNMTDERILQSLDTMKEDANFSDIKTVTASNGNICIYSTEYMSEKYAKALCEHLEVSKERHQ